MGISEVDFGVKFLTKCDKYFHQNNSEDAQSEIINVKEDYVYAKGSSQSSFILTYNIQPSCFTFAIFTPCI